MSALCQKRTFRAAAIALLFDQLISGRTQLISGRTEDGGDGDAERLRGLEVDEKFTARVTRQIFQIRCVLTHGRC